jgi:hypothetical protein
MQCEVSTLIKSKIKSDQYFIITNIESFLISVIDYQFFDNQFIIYV